MIEQHGVSGVVDEALERQDNQEEVVDFAKERDDVWNEIDRRDDVHERAECQEAIGARHARIAEQAKEQPDVVRHQSDGVHHRPAHPAARSVRLRQRALAVGHWQAE